MITVKQAAANLGISPRRVRALCKFGRIECFLQTNAPKPYYLIPADFEFQRKEPGRPRKVIECHNGKEYLA